MGAVPDTLVELSHGSDFVRPRVLFREFESHPTHVRTLFAAGVEFIDSVGQVRHGVFAVPTFDLRSGCSRHQVSRAVEI